MEALIFLLANLTRTNDSDRRKNRDKQAQRMMVKCFALLQLYQCELPFNKLKVFSWQRR